jgi:hypothetical protein
MALRINLFKIMNLMSKMMILMSQNIFERADF